MNLPGPFDNDILHEKGSVAMSEASDDFEYSAGRIRNDLSGRARDDVMFLHAQVRVNEERLARLPVKSQRTPEQQVEANKIHEICRDLRRRFMTRHTSWLYYTLTEGLQRNRTLQELAFGAAELCPGLVPTRSQIKEEQDCSQAEKEGWEIDQGIFFHHLLRDVQIGTHLYTSALHPTRRALELLAMFRGDGYLNLGKVAIERRGRAAHLTINNQECLNAEDDGLVEDLETAIDLALLNEDVHVGVLRGGVMTHPRYIGRRVFSSGINLKALHSGKISFIDFLLRRELGLINKVFRGLVHLQSSGFAESALASSFKYEKAWIAVVDTFAIGGGAQLLLVFDHVIAADDSYFTLPAGREGIVPGMANLRLRRLVGSRMCREVVLRGRRIQANEADAMLIFDEVLPSRDIESAIEARVLDLCNPAIRVNRHMINLGEESVTGFLRYAAEFAQFQAERLYSDDVLAKTFRSNSKQALNASLGA